jgi:signal transduction histidine kinase
MESYSSVHTLQAEIEVLKMRLEEANDTLDAIRSGQIDALVVKGDDGHALYTLRSADHTYRIFVEEMTEGAVTLNTAGLILFSNAQFASMARQPLSSVLGRPFLQFVAAADRPLFEQVLQDAWQDAAKREEVLLGDTDALPVQLSLKVLNFDGDKTLSMIITDLTQQKKTEAELTYKNEQLEILNNALLSSNHDLQQFASVASHDLQEPLRKIQVFSTFLKERSFHLLPDSSRQFIDKIIAASNRMKTLIVDILTYSRLSANDAQPEAVHLRTLVAEVLDDFDLKITEQRAVIEVGELPVVEGNRGQLRQVFYNLLSNALKFSTPGSTPHVTIASHRVNAVDLGVALLNEEQYCHINIRDNGIGFDEKFAYAIFSLFEKLHHKSTFEGSGIGLAIAKKIIDKHHGLIIAKSTPGKGSEFSIILPLKQTNPDDHHARSIGGGRS